MPERNYTVTELCGRCSQSARYTDEHGNRVCSHHATGVLSVRDIDVPRLLVLVEDLMEYVKSAGPISKEIRGLIGRRGP
jgi:hypothetical protein